LTAEMMAQASRDSDPVEQMWAHLAVGIDAFYCGDFSMAHAHFAQVATLYAAQQHPQYLLDPKILSLSFDSLTLWMLGQPDGAARQSQEAIAWARTLSHPYNGVAALVMAAWLSVHCREGSRAEEQVEALLPVAHTHGFAQYLAIGTLFRGCAYVEQGQTVEGVRLISEGIEARYATKTGVGMSAWQGLLASPLGDLGYTDEALARLAEAESVMTRSGERFFEAELYRIRGEVLRRQFGVRSSGSQEENQKSKIKSQKSEDQNLISQIPNPYSEIEACFLKALDVARQQQAKSFELRAVMSLVRLRQRQAVEQGVCTALVDAHNMLSEVYGWFTEGFETKDLREARALLEELEDKG